MNTKNGGITAKQFMVLIACYIIGSVLLLSFIDNLVKQDTWASILLGFAASLPFLLSYAYLIKRFPGMDLLEIMECVYGKAAGWILSAAYAGFFLTILSFNLRDLADFYTGYVMPEEPMAVFLIVAILVAGYAVRKGIPSVAQVAMLSVAFTAFTVVLTTLLLIKDIDLGNFLPLLTTPAPKLVQSAHIMSALPICEMFVLLMVVPHLRQNAKPVRHTLGGVALAVLMLLAIALRNTAVLGPSTSIFSGNSYQAVRMIDIAGFFTRIELFVAIGITLSLFVKICVLFYAVLKSCERIFRLQSFVPLILPVGCIAASLAFIAFGSTVEHVYEGMRYHPFFSLLFAYILPPLTIVVAMLRGRPGESGAQGA